MRAKTIVRRTGRCRSRGAGLALAVVLLTAAPAAAAKPGTVSGTVTNLAEEPLAGARVRLLAGDDVAATATSDKRGRFKLSAEAGDYRIVAEKEGYAAFEHALTLEAGDRQRLELSLLDAAAARRNEAVAAFNAGARAYRAGDRDAARESFLAVIAVDPELAAADPELVDAYALLAGLHRDAGAWTEAAQAAETYLAARPGDRQVQLVAYQAYRKLGDEERAATLRTSLAADPELAAKLALQAFNEGALADQAGDATTAVARFREALTLDARLAAAHFGLAALHYRAGRHDEAMTSVEAGLALEPSSAQGRRLAFAVREARGEAEAAAEALGAYAEIDPDGAAALLFERAESDFQNGESVEARKGLTRLLEIRPDHARGHHLMGLALLATDAEAARRYLERFLELAPEDPEAPTVREILASLG